MADGDPWVGPFLEAARGVPQEPESRWHLRSADGHSWKAVLRFHGESAVEAQIYRDGELVLRRRPRRWSQAVPTVTERIGPRFDA